MSSIELMMMVAHKMMKEGSMDKRVIDQSIPILHRLAPEFKFDKGSSPSDNLKVITEHISKHFQSLQQISNRQALESFTQAKRSTFDQMIELENNEINDKMKLIDNALRQCTNIYRVCRNTCLLTTETDKGIKDIQEKIVGIVNSFDGSNSLTTSIDGQILVLEAQISALKRDTNKIIKRDKDIRGLVSPRLESSSVHKKECIDMLGKPTPT